jgi:hypothetical protein
MILAIVLFQNGVDAKSPAVSYLTLQNKFKFWCCELPTVLMLIQNIIAIVYEDDKRYDDYSFFAWVGFFYLANLMFFMRTTYLYVT